MQLNVLSDRVNGSPAGPTIDQIDDELLKRLSQGETKAMLEALFNPFAPCRFRLLRSTNRPTLDWNEGPSETDEHLGIPVLLETQDQSLREIF